MSKGTVLPKAVQAIGDAAEAAAIESGMKPGKPVETASSQLAAVASAPTSKVDQNDYKKRYVNYKKTTDKTISELRQTLATTQATLADTQRLNQELQSSAASSTVVSPSAPAAIPAAASDELTKNSPVYLAYLDKLPKSIKDEYTEDYLFDQFVIQSSVGTTGSGTSAMHDLEEKVNNIAATQEKTVRQLFEEEMDSAFPNDEWIILTERPEWDGFCRQSVSPVDQRTNGQLVDEANRGNASKNIIWVLNEFKKHLQMLDSSKPADPLESQLTPEGAGSGTGSPADDISVRTETFTQSQVSKFYVDVTKNVYTPEEAKAIEANILAADTAGNIIPG